MHARKKLAIVSALVLALALAYFCRKPLAERAPAGRASAVEGAAAPESAAQRSSAPEPPPAGAARAPARSEPLPASLPETLAARFPNAVPLERQSRPLPDGALERRLLVGSGDRDFPFVVWEERLEPEAAGGEPRVVRAFAYRGDGFVVDADPSAVARRALDALIAAEGLSRAPFESFTNAVVVALPNPSLARLDAALERFGARLGNALVGRDILYFPSAAPSDLRVDRAWHLEQIGAVEAWDFQTGSASVIIAVVDTGVNVGHPDLSPNIWVNPKEIPGNGLDDDQSGEADDVRGWDFLNDDSSTEDPGGHGTHVAGIVGARGNNGFGAVGVNWNVRILPLKAGNASSLPTSAIIKALDYARMLRIRGENIVATNNSYGSEGQDALLRSAVDRQLSAGIVFVAAAGNSRTNLDGANPEYPAAFDHANIITVVNTTQDDSLAFSSSYGAKRADLGAPGEWIYSTYEDGYEFLSGTSMASPMVAGAVGLLAAAEPGLSWQELKARVLDTVDPAPALVGRTVTGGRLNALAMLRPGVKGHFISIPSHAEKFIILDDARAPVEFRVDALEGAAVSAEIVSGSGAEILDTDGRRFRFSASSEGEYTIRFVASLFGVQRVDTRSVFVGAPSGVSSGLRHHWRFDGSGNSEPDRAGSSNGSLAGVDRVDTPFGRAARFSGQGARMNFNAQHSAQVTFAALLKPSDLAFGEQPRVINTPYYYLYMASYNQEPLPDGNRNTLKFLSERTASFGVWNSPPNSVRNGDWLYVVGAYDSSSLSNAPRLYINGRLQTARIQALPAGSQVTAGSAAFVGNNDDNTRPFNGIMKDARIYDRALDEAEIARLGALLAESKWSRYAIQASGEPELGEIVAYRLVDDKGAAPEGALEWTARGLGENQIASSNAGELRIRYRGNAQVLVSARASDGLSTRYFSRLVETDFPPVSSGGVYEGETDDGGLVWMEVDPSLEFGYVTILQENPPILISRAVVTIDGDGNFESAGSEGLGISGRIDGGFFGEAAGTGLAFSGGIKLPASGESEYEGEYVGGEIGKDGRFVRARVLRDGTLFFWIEAPALDLGKGVIDDAGEFGFDTAAGERIVGSASGRTLAATRPGGHRLFLIDRGIDRGPAFEAVSIASFAGARALALAGFRSGVEPRARIINLDSAVDGSTPMAAPGFVLAGIKRLTGEEIALVERPAPSWATHDLFVGSVEVESAGSPRLLIELLEEARAPEAGFHSAAARATVAGEVEPAVVSFRIAGSEPRLALALARSVDLGSHGLGEGAPDLALRIDRLDASGAFAFIGSNDDWRSDARAAKLIETFASLGIAELGDADAAMLVWLEPGVYVARASEATGASGAAALEVYSVR